ncbi:hypothetical protein [Candidatus Neptunochlamydia vexilliferae]|uniref:hypothetical protein n=1 Tax=Candidatus Neptunichlamydia vexilliferae TaxID=1651774 RepID=UPI001890E4F9|nr:hypothetical protein [Candidatus Neptunochlamydia vexilliferae]
MSNNCISSYPRQLQGAVTAIQKHCSDLLADIQKGGDFKIILSDRKNFEDDALWHFGKRELRINANSYSDYRADERKWARIGDMVFELFNALKSKDFSKLYDSKLPLEAYVEMFEGLETDTMMKTRKLLEKFPGFPQYLNFAKDHYGNRELDYLRQQATGHAGDIVRRQGKSIDAYKGTWLHPVRERDAWLSDILDLHIEVIQGEAEQEELDVKLRKFKQLATLGIPKAKQLLKNLSFFNEKLKAKGYQSLSSAVQL